ncbi:MAG: universal stress protein, partial [Cyclobacteriaceae bacterium]|nr:universal stress protein [Cyclobacteriaceae bacterium]
FATSLHEDEKECLSIVKNAQKIYDAKLHLVRINTPNNFERDKDSLDTMKEYAEKNNLENYTLNVFNDVTEEEGIIYFADHINADLIALATHGRTGFAHLLSGSIAEDVVSHANRPVLTHVIKG